MASDSLARFSEPTQRWFQSAFAQPTAAQEQTWGAVSEDRHALVVAPTGSGKTLAAFLWAIDDLLTADPPEDPVRRCRVLYVSPLKALAADVERNLDVPLAGIRRTAAALGVDGPDVRVAVRTGDTPPAQRRAFAARPSDILITTPESLYLVLTSRARTGLTGVRTVIVDEIHALAGTKRGAHLALSLERLDALLDEAGTGPAQRIGLSATVRPVDEVARFLTGARTPDDGGRDVVTVQPRTDKRLDVRVQVPVPDLTDLGGASEDPERHASIWPHVHDQVVDLIAQHRSTLVFTNSRRVAERLTSRINETWTERSGVHLPHPGELTPAQGPSASGTSVGVDTSDAARIVARAHHGSMSRAERTRTEQELKAGLLPAVVATSSLELGIDMGAIDLMVQVGAPPSVASGLQRVGRAGHQVGAVSTGVLLPTFRGELISSAVIAQRMRDGLIEETRVLRNPLDVLAQQIVAMVATAPWHVDALATVVRRAAPYSGLGDASLRAVLDMLAGRCPAEDFAQLRPRLVWDRTDDVLTGRPGAGSLAVTSGGTIPDRGLYGVFLVPGGSTDIPTDEERVGGRAKGGRRVGELDEEMVFESRVGDTFTLGSSTWRIEQITADRVLVSPAPGVPGRLPFWKGDSPARPAELGRAMGAWLRRLDDATTQDLAVSGMDAWAIANLTAYLHDQRQATGVVPTDQDIVVETFRDELGDWRLVVHSPLGAQIHAPWALIIAARLRERYGVDPSVMHADDGIVAHLPDTVGPVAVHLDDLLIEPDQVMELVQHELVGSARFAARFRESAARALLLPRHRPDARQPLWKQRHRAGQLLAVASAHPDFPIVLEAVRECLQDDFDTAGLADLMRGIRSHQVRVHQVSTARPSPFAQSLLFGYTAEFLYDGDAPLAERRSAALTLDPTLLAELVQPGAGNLADLLVATCVTEVEAELAGVTDDRVARSLEQVADVLRRHGPLSVADLARRVSPEARPRLSSWLAELARARRAIVVDRTEPGDATGPDHGLWALVEDAGRLRDALGVVLPDDVPDAFRDTVADPWGDLVRRHARTHGPFAPADVVDRFRAFSADRRSSQAVAADTAGKPGESTHEETLLTAVTQAIGRLERSGHLVRGALRPPELGGTGDEVCDPDVLRLLRRRSLAALRAEVAPAPSTALGMFLPRWHEIGRLSGPGGLAQAVEQLAGAQLPASELDAVLSARVVDYAPRMVDDLLARGEVVWCGHGDLGRTDWVVSLHPTGSAELTLPTPAPVPGTDLHRDVLGVLDGGGSWLLNEIADRLAEPRPTPDELATTLWDLVGVSRVTNDRWSMLQTETLPVGLDPRRTRLGLRQVRRSPVPPRGQGRWSALPDPDPDATARSHATAVALLERHGVVSSTIARAEGLTGPQFAAVRQVLNVLEESGQVRRGYFVENLGGTQFAVPGAVDLLRSEHPQSPSGTSRTRSAVTVLAAVDPANPYGAALTWPEPSAGGRPARRAGAAVVLADGRLIATVDRGAGSLTTFDDDDSTPAQIAEGLTRMSLTVRRINGEAVPGPGTSTPMASALTQAGFTLTPRGLRAHAHRA